MPGFTATMFSAVEPEGQLLCRKQVRGETREDRGNRRRHTGAADDCALQKPPAI